MKKFLAIISAIVILFVGASVASAVVEKHDTGLVSITGFITQEDFPQLLNATLDVENELTILINSFGGDAWACMAMVHHIQFMQMSGIHVTTFNMGLAASAGAIIWTMGDTRYAAPYSVFMFHLTQIYDHFGQPIDKKSLPPELRKIIGYLDYFVRQLLLNILKDTEIVNELLKEGNNWYSADAIEKLGLGQVVR